MSTKVAVAKVKPGDIVLVGEPDAGFLAVRRGQKGPEVIGELRQERGGWAYRTSTCASRAEWRAPKKDQEAAVAALAVEFDDGRPRAASVHAPYSGLHTARFGREALEREFALAWQAANEREDGNLLAKILRREPSTRDWEVASTLVQWLGSHVGGAFREDAAKAGGGEAGFVTAWKSMNELAGGEAAHLGYLLSDGTRPSPPTPTAKEAKVAEAVVRWLGSEAGKGLVVEAAGGKP